MKGVTIGTDMVLPRGFGVVDGNVSKSLVVGEVRRKEENFEVHHVVNDDLKHVGIIPASRGTYDGTVSVSQRCGKFVDSLDRGLVPRISR